MSTPVETLAIMLQRAKSHMETTGLSAKFKTIYQELSRNLFDFEVLTGVEAATLRDAEDDDDDQVTTWECPECSDNAEVPAVSVSAPAPAPYCSECGCEMERTD